MPAGEPPHQQDEGSAPPPLYQISRDPTCTWRGSPSPARIVPSKLKIRFVVWGTSRLVLLSTLKTSTMGSSDIEPPSLNSFEMRTSRAEYVLSLRPVLRCTI